jgi:PEP-CTERM motif
MNNFAGPLGLANVVEFLSVTVDPPGSAHLDLQVENLFVNPSMLPPGSEFLEDMAVSDPSISIVNPVQVVAENAPEPSTLPLSGLALGALTWLWRRRWRSDDESRNSQLPLKS